MIGLCTDSNSLIPPELARRYDVEVVPLTVSIDGEALLEGVDIDVDTFWARFAIGITTITTSAPSPGQFLEAYRALAARGASAILSVHVSAAVSSTVEAARLGARGAPVEVAVVDSGTASFGVSCALLEAAEALRSGSSLEGAAQLAAEVGASTGNVFVLGGLDLARQGGRLGPGSGGRPGVPVLSMIGGKMTEVDQARDLATAVAAMATHIIGQDGPLRRVAIGTADPDTEGLALALEDRLRSAENVKDLRRYRIGPSVGAHTGPGTVGAYWYPHRS